VERRELSHVNVVATFEDLAHARKALDALEAGGIEAGDVSLLGRQPEEAAHAADTSQRDQAATADVAKRAVTGAAAGSVTGGVLGFLAGAVAFGLPGVGPVVGAGIWAATAGGAVAGGAVGGMVGGVAKLDMNPDWELTYEDVAVGRTLVAVHARDDDEGERALRVLEKEQPLKLERFDRAGKRLGTG
jgi:hypothetical protein